MDFSPRSLLLPSSLRHETSHSSSSANGWSQSLQTSDASFENEVHRNSFQRESRGNDVVASSSLPFRNVVLYASNPNPIALPPVDKPPKSATPAAMNPVFTLLPLTAAAIATATFMYPVDVLRALKMSAAGDKNALSIGQYYQKFGWRGFVSQGVIPEIAKSSLMRVSKFFFFPIICENLYGKSPKDSSILQKASAGALATVPEIIMISPLEVAKLGLQLDADNKFKNNSTQFIKHQFQTRGISGLYVGWAGMQWRQSFWTGTYFATLQWWKDLVEPFLTNNLGAPKQVSQLIAGFLAGFFATFPNAPGDVVRSVVQKKVFKDPTRPAYGVGIRGVVEHVQVAKEIFAVSGLRGLYSGLGFKSMHLGGSGALMALFVPVFSQLMGIPYSGV